MRRTLALSIILIENIIISSYCHTRQWSQHKNKISDSEWDYSHSHTTQHNTRATDSSSIAILAILYSFCFGKCMFANKPLQATGRRCCELWCHEMRSGVLAVDIKHKAVLNCGSKDTGDCKGWGHWVNTGIYCHYQTSNKSWKLCQF